MDTFEKNLAKKELETLQAINRNINFLGRKLEMTNNILGKYGIAILPGAKPSITEDSDDFKQFVSDVDQGLKLAGFTGYEIHMDRFLVMPGNDDNGFDLMIWYNNRKEN